MFGLWGASKKLKDVAVRLENFLNEEQHKRLTDIEKYVNDKHRLKEEVEDLKLKRKIEEEDIAHMVKIRDEKLDIQYQKKELELKATLDKQLHEEHIKYRDKTEKMLSTQATKMETMYKDLMQRLPDVNVMLGDYAEKKAKDKKEKD